MLLINFYRPFSQRGGPHTSSLNQLKKCEARAGQREKKNFCDKAKRVSFSIQVGSNLYEKYL